MTILLAEDERMIRMAIHQMIDELYPNEHSVIEAKNGEELVYSVGEYSPDIVFVDIKMPLLDGLSAIERCNEKNYITKWVVLTGYAEFDYAKRAINNGVTNYLLKPVSAAELKTVINKISAEIDSDRIESQDKISLIKKYIDEHYMNNIGISAIAEKFELSPNYLSKLFHNKTGQKFIDYLTNIRIQNAKALLLQNCDLSINEVANQVGYYSTRHFTRTFVSLTGMRPSDFRNSNA